MCSGPTRRMYPDHLSRCRPCFLRNGLPRDPWKHFNAPFNCLITWGISLAAGRYQEIKRHPQLYAMRIKRWYAYNAVGIIYLFSNVTSFSFVNNLWAWLLMCPWSILCAEWLVRGRSLFIALLAIQSQWHTVALWTRQVTYTLNDIAKIRVRLGLRLCATGLK